MKILSEPTIENCLSAIRQDYPSLTLKTTKLINNGWDNTVIEINDDYIFRFPKKDSGHDDLEISNNFYREINLLEKLQGKISLEIPKIEFTGLTNLYVGYLKIKGTELDRSALDELDGGQRKILTRDLAQFLRQLHSAITVAQAEKMGLYHLDLVREIATTIHDNLGQMNINTELKSFISKTCNDYMTISTMNIRPTLLHNDLHGNNIALDSSHKKINGVFDFSDAVIGDRHIDFQKLYQFDPKFTEEIVNEYNKSLDLNISISQIELTAKISEILNIARHFREPESKIYRHSFDVVQRLFTTDQKK